MACWGTVAVPLELHSIEQDGVGREQRDRPKHEGLECLGKSLRKQPKARSGSRGSVAFSMGQSGCLSLTGCLNLDHLVT